MDKRGAEAGARANWVFSFPNSVSEDGISTDPPGDILKRLLAKISEFDRDLAVNLFVSGRRDADAPRFSDPLKPSRNVNAITEDVLALDQDVPEIDPDPKQHTPVLRDTFVPLSHHRLHSNRTLDRIDHRGKLKENTVSGGLHEPPPVLLHECIGDLAVFAECTGCADLVEAHERRLSVNLGDHEEKRSQPHRELGQMAATAATMGSCKSTTRRRRPPK